MEEVAHVNMDECAVNASLRSAGGGGVAFVSMDKCAVHARSAEGVVFVSMDEDAIHARRAWTNTQSVTVQGVWLERPAFVSMDEYAMCARIVEEAASVSMDGSPLLQGVWKKQYLPAWTNAH